ncbi:dihydrodipicolinate synthase family protein [Taklimakanibacter deserti]|uniref:dihydrodipicolinate synthase family protein n=1 Tax=Taklimakanibacter deserti TaxID=2267839 RepID=UPI000E65BBD6
MVAIKLPDQAGKIASYRLTGTPLEVEKGQKRFNRVAFAAAHIVVDPLRTSEPSASPVFDWERTLAFRHHLLDLGFGIAEAMDTAQRGMGLDWPGAHELIRQSLNSAKDRKDAVIFSGCGTEQLDPAEARSLDDVIAAYLTQLHAIQKLGGRIILMASRALARIARTPRDYETVYARVLSEADQPVILHWLGDMFDPGLKGYWGAEDFAAALDTALRVIAANQGKVDGIKISLLDDQKEIVMRRRLPNTVKMYTGDDFNYPALIEGDAHGHSHALLGIFDPIAPAASLALEKLAQGDRNAYAKLLEPTVPLSRLIFRAPTQYYKTGVVFLAWLNGFQDHFTMAGGAQSLRSIGYFADILRLADQAGLLSDPDLACTRMRQLLALHGIENA